MYMGFMSGKDRLALAFLSWAIAAEANVELPDVVEDVQAVSQVQPPTAFVTAPPKFLPDAAYIHSMPPADSSGRMHFYISAMVLFYAGVVVLGTFILWLGTKCKNCRSEPEHILSSLDSLEDGSDAPQLPPQKAGLSRRCKRALFAITFSFTYSATLAAAFASGATGRLSQKTGLCWEVYLILFGTAGVWQITQAIIAAVILPKGRRYGLKTFFTASLSGMCPIVSDAYDTLKDMILAALCWQSGVTFVQVIGILSLVHLAALHIYCSFFDDKCLAQLCGSHLSVLVASTEDTTPEDTSTKQLPLCRRLCNTILPMLYKQVTPTKRKLMVLENVPQAFFAICYLKVIGGSLFVGLLNLAIPVFLLIMAHLSYGSLQRGVAPWTGERLSAALEDRNELMEQKIRDEADFSHDLALFRLVVPHCDAFNDVFPELDDIQDVDDARLRELCVACEFLTSRARVAIQCDGLEETGIEAVGDALRSSPGVQQVYVEATAVDAECAKLIATLLDTSSPVQSVTLDPVRPDALDDDDAQELVEALEFNASLRRVFFYHDQIGEERAEAIAQAMDPLWNVREKALAQGIPMDTSKSLLCNSTEIGEDGVEAFVAALEERFVVKEVSLAGVGFGMSVLEALAGNLFSCYEISLK
eukprot:s1607_g5.t1